MRTIRASEIAIFLFCQRAWWYQKTGSPSENLEAMAAGKELHFRHGRAALRVGCLRILAYILILLALVSLAVHITTQLI